MILLPWRRCVILSVWTFLCKPYLLLMPYVNGMNVVHWLSYNGYVIDMCKSHVYCVDVIINRKQKSDEMLEANEFHKLPTTGTISPTAIMYNININLLLSWENFLVYFPLKSMKTFSSSKTTKITINRYNNIKAHISNLYALS